MEDWRADRVGSGRAAGPGSVDLRIPANDGGPGDLIDRRHSTREFAAGGVDIDDLGRLLWSGYGLRSDGGRTVPSAHGLYPLALTVVAGEVDGLPSAAYRYEPDVHRLVRTAPGDHRRRAADTSIADSGWLPTASVLILLGADIDRVDAHFAEQPPLGRRGERYVWLEAGHVSQNLYLTATERGLGAVLVAGFDDDLLGELMIELGCAGAGDRPLTILAIGPCPTG